jgi:DNA-binding transcriptional LysR family regulator
MRVFGNTWESALNWDDLKVALAVGRTGSLSRAALQLGVNQSTATRRLVALEAEIGTSLFVRSQAGLTPTEAGRIAIARAGEVERRIDRLTEQVNDSNGSVAGILHLRGNHWVLKRLIDYGMQDFFAEHANLELCTVNHYNDRVISRGATVSIWFERNPRDMEFAIKLGTVPYAVYAKAGEEAETMEWLGLLDEDAPRRTPSKTTDQLREKGARLRFTATDADIVLSAVANGLGRALLPMCLAENNPALARVGDGPPELSRTLSIHLHPDTVQTSRVRAFVRWLRGHYPQAFAPCDVA